MYAGLGGKPQDKTKNQYKVLASVMQNFAHAQEAAQTATQSQGSAIEENNRYMEGWEASINNLKGAWQNFSTAVIKDTGLPKAVQGLTNFVNKVADSTFATKTFTGALAGLLGVSGLGILGNIIPALVGGIAKIGQAMKSLGNIGTILKGFTSIETFAGSFSTLLSGVVGWGGVIAALASVTKLIADFTAPKNVVERTGKALEETKDVVDSYLDNWDKLTDIDKKAFSETVLPKYYEQYAKYQEATAKEATLVAKAQHEALDSARAELNMFFATGEETINGFELAKRLFDAALETGDPKVYENYLKSYSDYADALRETVMSQEEYEFVSQVDYIRDRYNMLTDAVNETAEATGELTEQTDSLADSVETLLVYQQQVAEAFDTTDDIARQAAEGLAEYQEAIGKLTDYEAPLKGYQETFKSIQEQFKAGGLDYFESKLAVDLLLPEGSLAEYGYNIQQALSAAMEGTAASILQATDPLSAFNQKLYETQQAGLAAGKTYEEMGFAVAEVDGQLVSDIYDWELTAQSIGTNEALVKALASAFQAGADEVLYTTAQLRDLQAAMQEAGAETSFQTMYDALVEVGTALGETDVGVVQKIVKGLQEIGAISIDETDINFEGLEAAETKLKEIQDAIAKTGEDKPEVEFDVNSEAVDAKVSELEGKSITIPVRFGVSGIGTTLSGIIAGIAGHAKGTDNAEEGLSLVNEEGAEIIQSGDRAYIAGGGEPTITHLNKGDMVFNAKQTKDILGNNGAYQQLIDRGISSHKNDSSVVVSGVGAAIRAIFKSGDEKPDFVRWEDVYGEPKSPDSPLSDAEAKEALDEWVRVKKHALAMDEITEREYYDELEQIYKQYLEGREDLEDEYWKYEEQIYKYRKQQQEDEIDRENKLNELAKAKTQRVLVYKDGMFQYVQNTEAISKAQRGVIGYADGTTHATAGVHLVGEKGAELRVLGEGDGIIPANFTKNLMRLGSMSFDRIGAVGNTEVNTFNIGKVILEKINDVDGLFSGLKNLAMQTATARA